MIRLHDNLSSGNGYKARLLLAQLGVPFERVEYDIDRAETRTPEFLRMNPNGRVPVLELEDGRFLPESNAILFYMSEGILLVYSLKRHDQLAGASAANPERRVAAIGMSFSQLVIRPTLIEAAVASSCRSVFFRPR